MCWAVPSTRVPAVARITRSLLSQGQQLVRSHRFTGSPINRSPELATSMMLIREDNDKQKVLRRTTLNRVVRAGHYAGTCNLRLE